MRAKHFTLFMIILLLLTGCSTITTKMVDPTGRVMPDPHFVLRAVGTPLTVSFYYTAYETVKDVDGSIVAKPVFLTFLDYHDLYAERYKAVTLTIEVNNPSHIEYSLYQKTEMEIGKARNKIQAGGEMNRSNLEYRQFVYNLPFKEDVRKVDHVVLFHINDNEVMKIGHFRYDLIH